MLYVSLLYSPFESILLWKNIGPFYFSHSMEESLPLSWLRLFCLQSKVHIFCLRWRDPLTAGRELQTVFQRRTAGESRRSFVRPRVSDPCWPPTGADVRGLLAALINVLETCQAVFRWQYTTKLINLLFRESGHSEWR